MFEWKKNSGWLLGLFLIGFIIYAFNLNNPLFWDDVDWILNNATLHALTWANIKFIFSHNVLAGIGQVSNYYRPFLFLTFLANYLISGPNPVLYHIVSNGIHIFNACLIFYLLTRWLGSKRVAFLTALLFLIHPLQTEAVAYISGRGDSLSVFFMLLSLLLWINDIECRYGKTVDNSPQRHRMSLRVLSVISMVLAVLSRETAVLFPAYLGVALMAFEYKGLIWERFKKAFISTLLFIGISVIYGILRLTVFNFQNTLNFYQQQNIYSEHLSYRVYTFFHALVVYIRLVFWPVGLHMDRDIPVSIHIWDGWSWLGALIIIMVIVQLFILYRRTDKILFNVWFFGSGIFFVNLLPTSGIVPINARIYEHWLYFSLFGLFVLVAFYLDKTLSFFKNKNSTLYSLFIIFLIIYFSFFGVQTIRRNIIWGDTEAFYLNILYYEPQDVRVLNNLGNWYSDRGNNVSAGPLYERAISADPSQPAPYYNLGNIARDSGQLIQAEALYQKAIAVDPTFHYAYGNLAQLYLNQNKLDQALAELQALEKIYPTVQTEKNIEMLQRAINK